MPRGCAIIGASSPISRPVPRCCRSTTRPWKARYVRCCHAGSFLVIDRQALTPYLFSAENGDPMTYFHYLRRPYAPSETWYRAAEPVDWRAVECAYEYVLAMQPFDAQRLPLPTATIARNRTASLLKIAGSRCAALPGEPIGTTGAGLWQYREKLIARAHTE